MTDKTTPTDVSGFASKEVHALILEIARMLNGLSPAEAINLLNNVREVVLSSTTFSVDDEKFQHQLKMFNQVFGETDATGTGERVVS